MNKTKCVAKEEPHKSNMQKKGCGFETHSIRYADFHTTVKSIYAKEGITAFAKGVFPRICINVPSTALSWGSYEFVKSFLNKSSKE